MGWRAFTLLTLICSWLLHFNSLEPNSGHLPTSQGYSWWLRGPLWNLLLCLLCVVHSPGSAGTAYTAAHVVLPLLGRSLRANRFVSGLDFWERLGVALDVSSCIIANIWAGGSSLSVCFAWNCSCQRAIADVKGHKTFVWKWLPFSALSWSLLHKTPCNLEDPYPIPREFITF